MSGLGGVPALALLGVVAFIASAGLAAPAPSGRALLATAAVGGLATAVAVGLGLTAALYLHTLASHREIDRAKVSLRLAGANPPVVAGWFAGVVAGPALGETSGVLLAGITLGLWCTPRFAIRALRVLATRHGAVFGDALGLGIGPVTAAWRVLLPAAAADLFAVGLGTAARASGEAMVALLAAGATHPLAVAALSEPGAALALLGLVGGLLLAARHLEAAQ